MVASNTHAQIGCHVCKMESEQGSSTSISFTGNPGESSTSSACLTDDSKGSDTTPLFLLQRLRPPPPSELARKRSIRTNPPVGVK